VALIRRRPARLPLRVPRPDGSTWPTRGEVGRSSFAASTLYRTGHGEAFTPEAHDVADPLLAQVLPRLRVESAPEDLPYLRRVLGSAAQVGAGIALAEGSGARDDDGTVDRQVAGALLEAAGELPAMPAHQHAVATYFLHCGYYLARTGMAGLPVLLAELDVQA
jgi:hypothetical protein